MQREFAEGGVECREQDLQPRASGRLGARIEAPERGALGGVEVGEVDHALSGAGVVAVEEPAPARVLLQALEPGAVFVETDLVVAVHGPAHGGGVAPGEDQLEVGFGEGMQGHGRQMPNWVRVGFDQRGDQHRQQQGSRRSVDPLDQIALCALDDSARR